MSLPNFQQLHDRADAARLSVPVAVAGAADRTVLEALRSATDRGWVSATLAGSVGDIRRVAAESGIDLDGFRLVETDDPAGTAVAEIRAGRARMLVKGQIPTPILMEAVLDPEHGIRSGRVVCQVVLMELTNADRRFLMADTGICVKPKLPSKADIVRQTIGVAQALGVDAPRVAMMAASESVTTSMPETLDAAELVRRGGEGEFGAARIGGPLSFDLAFSPDAGTKKQVEGTVVGAADAMVFPDLLSANLTVKAIMYTAACRFGGVLRGTTVPVAFMSRADTTATRLNSLALALTLV